MNRKNLEAELRLCLGLLHADGEIGDREISFAVRHVLSRFRDVSYDEVLELVRRIDSNEESIEHSCRNLASDLAEKDIVAMLLSFYGIIYTDGAALPELTYIRTIGNFLNINIGDLERMASLFDARPSDYYDDDSIVVFGSHEDMVNIPLIGNRGTVLLYLYHENLYLVVRANEGLELNARPIRHDFFTALFEEDSFMSFCNNRYTFDYWNIRSFLQKEPGEGKHQYWIVAGQDVLETRDRAPDTSLAEAVREKNIVTFTPRVEGFIAGTLQMEPGRTYRLYEKEFIRSGQYAGVLQFSGNETEARRVDMEETREILLKQFDSSLPEECSLSARRVGDSVTISLSSCPARPRSGGRELSSPFTLQRGDRFIVSRLLIEVPESDESELIIRDMRITSMRAENIGVRFGKSERKVIDDITFEVAAGELTAVIGPAGSGKSTLLNALLGTQELESGRITINGNRTEKALQDISDYLGFVPQDDLLVDVLTVRENLYFTYRLKRPTSDLPRPQIEDRIDEVLKQVGLFHKKESRVGNEAQRFLSGGERRRLNIALELISDPDIIVLDEPTSGLSSMDAENIVGLLRTIANTGKILLMVIHQPSSAIYRMFDNTLILNKDGRLAFFGNNMRALTLFSEINAGNTESSMVECSTCHSLNPNLLLKSLEQETEAFWQVSREIQNIARPAGDGETRVTVVSNPVPEKTPIGVRGRLQEFGTQFRRLMLKSIRDRSNMILTLGVSPILGFFSGFLNRYSPEPEYTFIDNPHYFQFLFLLVIAGTFFGLSSSVAGILNDKLILKREKITRLSRGVYLFAKNLVLMAITSLQCILFVVPAQLSIGYPQMLVPHILLVMVVAFSSIALGLLISTFVKNVYAAYTLVPFILIPQIILGGLFLDFDRMNPVISDFGSGLSRNEAPLAASVIHARWAYEMLVTANMDLTPEEKLYRDEKKEIARIDEMDLDSFQRMMQSDEVRKKYRDLAEKIDFELNTTLADIRGKVAGEFLSTRRIVSPLTERIPEMAAIHRITWKHDLIVLIWLMILAELGCFVRLRRYPHH